MGALEGSKMKNENGLNYLRKNLNIIFDNNNKYRHFEDIIRFLDDNQVFELDIELSFDLNYVYEKY